MGHAYSEGKDEIHMGSVYDFLLTAKNNPANYMVVIGNYAKDYEIQSAEKIAQGLGVKLRYEEGIDIRTNMILIGTSGTNMIIDKLITQSYPDKSAYLTLAKGNLLVVINNEEQAKRVADTILGFSKEKELLSPGEIALGTNQFLGYIIGISIAVVVLGLLIIEQYRKGVISKAEEKKDEHKAEALSKYVAKYTSEGYSIDQIRKWLVNYGYDGELVEHVIHGVNNA
jgi:hypothetical protein